VSVEILLPMNFALVFPGFSLDEKFIQLAMSISEGFPWETIEGKQDSSSLKALNIDQVIFLLSKAQISRSNKIELFPNINLCEVTVSCWSEDIQQLAL